IDPDHDLTRLPSREIRAQLAARERDIKYHLESLKHEVTTAADITVGGRPLPEVARENAFRNALVTLGVGLAIGLLRGLRKRAGVAPRRPGRGARWGPPTTTAGAPLSGATLRSSCNNTVTQTA
ncbi:MAG: hypothetical protein ACLFTL_03315, partial [Alphaproteobacteria bacterium]